MYFHNCYRKSRRKTTPQKVKKKKLDSDGKVEKIGSLEIKEEVQNEWETSGQNEEDENVQSESEGKYLYCTMSSVDPGTGLL